MTDLSITFEEILSNRQSQRPKVQSKLKIVQALFVKYSNLSKWIKKNKEIILKFNQDVEEPLTSLEKFVNEQLSLIQSLLGTSKSEQVTIKQLLSRIERSWVSFSAIGAKRQGKGHMLSTLLNLQPENDIFLARAGKPCTAAVVTLYQGPKREAIFKEDGSFDSWGTIAKNKAFVYFHTYDTIVSLINQYFMKLGIEGTFSLNQKSKNCFVEECDKWVSIVESHNTNKAPVEYKELLLDYLKNADKYGSNIQQSDNCEPLAIDVDDLPLKEDTNKIDYINDDLRKYISYYRRNNSNRHFDVLAVKKVDIYTDYKVGDLKSDSFVISDTAGIGEAKLNLRETLRDLLKNNIDIALAVTKVPDDSDEDLSIPRQVIDFHDTISSDRCFVCFPLQFYYIINVRKSTSDTYSDEEIREFKDSLISHLKDRGLQIPSVGTLKPWDNKEWTKEEVAKWNDSHIRIIDVDEHEKLNEYFRDVVLPNVANDIAIIDNELLKSINNTIKSLTSEDAKLKGLCDSITTQVPVFDSDIRDSKVAEINNKILSVLEEDFANLSRAIASINELTEKPDLNDSQLKEHQKNTLDKCIKMLFDFQSKIEEFYNEPDWYRTLHAFNSKFEIDNSYKEECAAKKSDLFKNINVEREREKFEKWELEEWTAGIKERKALLLSIRSKLTPLSESLDADEIGVLANYRLKVLKELKTATDTILNSLAAESYVQMVRMIWKSFYEDGRFEYLVKEQNIEDYKITIIDIFNESKKYNCVVDVLDTIDSKDLSVIDKKLSKMSHDKLALAKIQPLICQLSKDDYKDIPKYLANSFWRHLVSIELDYKMYVFQLFEKDAILSDFKKTFMHLIATISHKLIEQDINFDGTKDSQKQFLNFYLNNFHAILPDSNLSSNIQIKDCIVELKEIIK